MSNYYSLWDDYNQRWSTGYRSSIIEGQVQHARQNPSKPWALTFEEVVAWLIRDWTVGRDKIDLSMSLEEVNEALKGTDLQIKECSDGDRTWADKEIRERYALKYL